jgi:K+-transporting ATPase ATPase C chain
MSGNDVPLDDNGGGPLDWLVLAALSILACGLLYPAIATLAAGAAFPHQSTGSLVEHDGIVVGSALVAQPFTSERYVHPRPSAAGYDMMALAGSNWGAGNPQLRDAIGARSAAIAQREGIEPGRIPVELVTASASGIDPHLTPEGARIQAPRVARARGLSVAQVEAVIAAHTVPATLGTLGQPRVNVLLLNLALDARSAGPQ